MRRANWRRGLMNVQVFEEGFQQSNAAQGPAADLTTSETKIPNYILKFP